VSPASVVANELESSFDLDKSYGRRLVRRRVSWAWHLLLEFDIESSVEEQERDWIVNPPLLARDVGQGFDQVRLNLRRSQYTHPARNEGMNGTAVLFTFEVDFDRIA